jgi:hypothetical protein
LCLYGIGQAEHKNGEQDLFHTGSFSD